MAEGARLESVYTLIAYRGFESLSHRQKKAPYMGAFICSERGVKPRGFDKTHCVLDATGAPKGLLSPSLGPINHKTHCVLDAAGAPKG